MRPHVFQSLRALALVAGTAVVMAGVGLTAAELQELELREGPPVPMARDDIRAPGEAPATGTAIVAGVVLSADLGRPIRRAVVRLSSTTPGLPLLTTADDQGRFRFDRVAAGQFTLTASKPGYLDSVYGQRKPGSGRPGTPLSIAEGQRVERLSVAIARGGVLAGTVLDDGGEPAFGTDVRALKYVWQNGERVLRTAGSTRADDRGGFRIGALPPGDYVLMATPLGENSMFEESDMMAPMLGNPPMAGSNAGFVVGQARISGGAPGSGSPQTATTGYAPVYYPGTTSGGSAGTIALGIGEERAALDLQLQLVPMGTVAGTITADDASQGAGTEVRLINLDQALPGLGTRSTIAGAGGRFSFTNVAPGRYRVNARSGTRQEVFVDQIGGQTRVRMQFSAAAVRMDGGPAMPFAPGPPPQQPARWATSEVIVAGRDTQSVSLVLQPGIAMSGRVAFDASAEPPADLSTIRIVLNTANASEGMSSASAIVGADGRFTIEGVVPGRYRVAVLAPGGLRAKSFEVGGNDALDFLLMVNDRNVPDATLTLTSRAAGISGFLQQATGLPASDYSILVFADDARYWTPQSRRVQATRPATDGRFSFRNLPAGAYRLVAVDDLEDGQWLDPAILRQVAGAAIAITIGDGENKTQDLRVK